MYGTVNFFEGVVYQKYGHLFEEDSEAKFLEKMEGIRDRVMEEVALLKVSAAGELDHYKTLSDDRLSEIKDLKSNFEI